MTAASGDRETTYDIVRRTDGEVFIPLTVGGGVRSVDDFDRSPAASQALAQTNVSPGKCG